MTSRRRGIGALGALLVAALAVVAPASLPRAHAAGALDVVAVLDGGAGARAVVAEVAPPPAAPLPADAASVRVDGAAVPATVTPLLGSDAPVGLVIDAASTGAAALPQRLSAAAGMLLQLPPSTPVSVVLDRSPPQILAERTTPAAAIHALASVTAGGSGSTAQAVAQVTASMSTPIADPTASAVVLLGTAQPAPSGNAAADLRTRLKAGRVVLALVTDPDAVGGGWAALAQGTGGAEAGATPEGTPDAVDSLTNQLRARYVVRFTPPAGASSARVTLTASGERSSADVSLVPTPGTASPAPASVTAGPQAAPAARASGAGTSSRVPLSALAAVAVLVLVGGAFLVTRRRRATTPKPAGVEPATAQSLSAEPADAVAAEPAAVKPAAVTPAAVEPAAAPAPAERAEPVVTVPVAAESAEPAAAEPAEPEAAEPVAAEPVAADLAAAELAAAEPAVEEPAAVEPAERVADESAAVKPAEAESAEPAEVEPAAAEPAAEPAAAEPAAEPAAAEPAAEPAEPVAAESAAVKPAEAESAEPAEVEPAGAPAEAESAEPVVIEPVAAVPVVPEPAAARTAVPEAAQSAEAAHRPATQGRRRAAPDASIGEPPVRGVRYFDLSDPKRPREITPSAAPSEYVGKHRQAGISDADVPVEEDVDDVDDVAEHDRHDENGVGTSRAGKDPVDGARRIG